MLRSYTTFILALTLMATTQTNDSFAQKIMPLNQVKNPYSNLKTLTGFQPSVLSSIDEAKKVYDSLPTHIFKGRSGCFQRAHTWAYDLNKNFNIKSMKVFLFFTARYQREFDYEWSYHVAPLIPVKNTDGSISELVFDPTFTSAPTQNDEQQNNQYDNKPITINEWIKYFIYPDVTCPIVENYSDYINYQDQYYCFVMKAPMYNYIPENFLTDESITNESWYDSNTKMRVNFRSGDLMQMQKAKK